MKKQPHIRILAATLTLAFCLLGSSSALAAPAATPTTRPEKEVVEPNDTTQTSLDYLEFLLHAGGPFRFQEAAIKHPADDADAGPAEGAVAALTIYSQTTNKPVTGIQCIDNRLYSFNADGVLENGKTFGVDVSKYQKNIDWNQIKKAGVSFVIVRIGYRGYGASGTLVLDPMFEEHFTNVKNAGLKVGVYFFSQATTEEEAKEEAFACAYVLNGRKLDYPIFFDTEASGASNGSGRADGLGMEDRTKCAIAFCEEVKAQGYKPGVYASTLWYRKRVNLNSLKKYTIWNAHYGVASSPIDCALWQGTCTARLPGYKGDMDVNISYIG